MTQPANDLETRNPPYNTTQIQIHYLERTVYDNNTWRALLNAAEFLCRLSQKLKINSPTFAQAGYRHIVFNMPYKGIPTAKLLDEQISGQHVGVKREGPEFFELSSEIGEVFYDFRKNNELRIFASWPKEESKKNLENLVDEVFGQQTQ